MLLLLLLLFPSVLLLFALFLSHQYLGLATGSGRFDKVTRPLPACHVLAHFLTPTALLLGGMEAPCGVALDVSHSL